MFCLNPFLFLQPQLSRGDRVWPLGEEAGVAGRGKRHLVWFYFLPKYKRQTLSVLRVDLSTPTVPWAPMRINLFPLPCTHALGGASWSAVSRRILSLRGLWKTPRSLFCDSREIWRVFSPESAQWIDYKRGRSMRRGAIGRRTPGTLNPRGHANSKRWRKTRKAFKNVSCVTMFKLLLTVKNNSSFFFLKAQNLPDLNDINLPLGLSFNVSLRFSWAFTTMKWI